MPVSNAQEELVPHPQKFLEALKTRHNVLISHEKGRILADFLFG